MSVYWLVRGSLGIVLRLLYRLEVVGRLPPGPSVVVANHESVLDPPAISQAARQPLHFLAKEELWEHRILGAVITACGAIPVSRGRAGHDALGRAAELIEKGATVMIFPSGTVSGGPWIRGAARLAIQTGVPMVPVRIIGTARALSGGRIGFPKLRVIVGEPVPVEKAEPTVAAARDLTRKLEALVDALA